MSLTYAIPDLHGRVDLLDRAIDRIVSHAAGQFATVVTLGDYVDRGPSSRQVIERLLGWPFETLKLVSLKGNHEAMMWDTCNHLADYDWWIKNGGDRTLASYTEPTAEAVGVGIVPRAHLDWIASLALMHVDRHRVFVHAAVDHTVSLQQQSEQTLLWKRYPAGFAQGHGQRHVVHGHHADRQAPITFKGRTNLDGEAWKTGRLVIGVFDDERPGGLTETIEIVGMPAERG